MSVAGRIFNKEELIKLIKNLKNDTKNLTRCESRETRAKGIYYQGVRHSGFFLKYHI